MPIDVQFFLADTFDLLLGPGCERIKSYAAAVEELNRRIMADRQQIIERKDTAGNIIRENNLDADLDCEALDDNDGVIPNEAIVQHYQEVSDPGELFDEDNVAEEEEDAVEEEDIDEDGEEFDNVVNDANDEDEAEFEREYSRLMNESLDSRRNERKVTPFDISVPTRTKNIESSNIVPNGQVAFTVLTKRGNKQQVFCWINNPRKKQLPFLRILLSPFVPCRRR